MEYTAADRLYREAHRTCVMVFKLENSAVPKGTETREDRPMWKFLFQKKGKGIESVAWNQHVSSVCISESRIRHRYFCIR